MKLFYISALALLTAIAAGATLPELEGKTPTPIPSFCRIENLIELVKCSCFVDTKEGTITPEVKQLCVTAFGDDLLALEDSCKGYVRDGKIDVLAVRKDVQKANEICVPLYLESAQGGISRQIETVGRQDTVVVIVITIIVIHN